MRLGDRKEWLVLGRWDDDSGQRESRFVVRIGIKHEIRLLLRRRRIAEFLASALDGFVGAATQIEFVCPDDIVSLCPARVLLWCALGHAEDGAGAADGFVDVRCDALWGRVDCGLVVCAVGR